MSELPRGWVEAPLVDVTDILDAIRKPVSNKERMTRIADKAVTDLYPYYGATGQAGTIDDYLFDEELVALGEDGVPFFDGKKHKAYMLYGKTWVNNHAHVLRGTGGYLVNKYLCEYLNQFDYMGYVNGGTRLKLTQANMKRIPIPLAPLAEQKRIVEKLDEVLAQVDTIKARLDGIPDLLKRFRQSVLASAVSGKLTGVADFSVDKFSNLILEMKNGLSPKPNEDGLGSPILRISSVRPKEVDFQDHRFLECEDKTKNIYSLRDRDLLFTRYNGSLEFVGVCGIVTGIGDKTYLYPDKLIRVRTDEKQLLPEYAELYFCCASTRKTITDFVKSTSGQKGISGKDLKSVDVSYPNVGAQKEIVRLVDQYFVYANTIEAQVKKAQARVDNLTQSILAKAFRGELVAQDPNDEPADKLLERITEARKEAEALAKAAKKAEAAKKRAAKSV